jgi:hypothetical protein
LDLWFRPSPGGFAQKLALSLKTGTLKLALWNWHFGTGTLELALSLKTGTLELALSLKTGTLELALWNWHFRLKLASYTTTPLGNYYHHLM